MTATHGVIAMSLPFDKLNLVLHHCHATPVAASARPKEATVHSGKQGRHRPGPD
jgi:hypothetical protein